MNEVVYLRSTFLPLMITFLDKTAIGIIDVRKPIFGNVHILFALMYAQPGQKLQNLSLPTRLRMCIDCFGV